MANKATTLDYTWDRSQGQWNTSRAFELRTNRKLKLRAIERLQREVAEIDRELEAMQKAFPHTL